MPSVITGYDSTALVVFTTTARRIPTSLSTTCKSLINNRVAAVALGTLNGGSTRSRSISSSTTPADISCSPTTSASSDIFKLQSYFVQMLAERHERRCRRGPRRLCTARGRGEDTSSPAEADYTADATFVVSRAVGHRFQIETPAGMKARPHIPGRRQWCKVQGRAPISSSTASRAIVCRQCLRSTTGAVEYRAGGFDRGLEGVLAAERGRPDARIGVPYSARSFMPARTSIRGFP